MKFRSVWMTACLLTALVPAYSACPGGASGGYERVDLGPLALSLSSQGVGLSHSGVLSGSFMSPDNGYTAYLWQDGTLTQLETPYGYAVANDVTESGVAVGSASGETNLEACLWDSSGIRFLGTLGGAFSAANAVNENRTVVGSSYTDEWKLVGFQWSDGVMSSLDLPGQSSSALDINASGQIVGQYTTADSVTKAFLWQNETWTDLLTPEATNSMAYAINDNGIVVGYYQPNGENPVACAWENGQLGVLADLSGAGAIATGVNNHGDIIGSSVAGNGDNHPVLWTGGEIRDLGPYVGAEAQLNAINDSGAIAGTTADGLAFLLVPGSSDVVPPVSGLSLSGLEGTNGWYRGPVTVSIDASDPDCDEATVVTYLEIDGETAVYTAPVVIAAEGTHTIRYWSVDEAGNEEESRSVEVNIDATAPVLQATPSESSLWPPNGRTVPVEVQGSVADAVSGVAGSAVRYRVGDSEGVVSTSGLCMLGIDGGFTFTVNLPAIRAESQKPMRTYTIFLQVNDVAGNEIETQLTVAVPHSQKKKTK